MRIDLDCPSCADRLRFASHDPTRDGQPLTTSCRGCGSPFRLWGGRLISLGPPAVAQQHRQVG